MAQSADQRHPFVVARRHRVERAERPEGNPEVARLLEQSLEAWLCDANDLKSVAAKWHAPANDARVATESPLPGRMTENDDRDAAIVRQEQSSERGVNA